MSQIYETKLNENIVQIAKSEKAILAIIQDSCPGNPREWDNLGIMICFHKKYDLGDKDHDYNSENYKDWEELEKAIYEQDDAAVILPLYLYDHSGITISTTSFASGWDSGRIGLIFARNKDVEENWPVEKIIGEHRDKVKKVLVAEVKTYDQYLRNDVYGFVLETPDGEEIDSCWGFYGDDFKNNGIAEHLGKYAKMIKDLEGV